MAPMGEGSPSRNGDGEEVQEGDLHNTMIEMKLFNAIAISAFLGSSLVAATPSEAGNGWIHAATSVKGESIYVRPLSRNGNFVTYEETLSGSGKYRFIANCPAWQYKRVGGTQWQDVMPQSIGAAAHRTVCSANIPTFIPTAQASGISYASCNEKVDAVFYRRYPELKGTKLTSMNGSLSREWMSIQNSLC